MKKLSVPIGLMMMIWLLGTGAITAAETSDPPVSVFVSILPQSYFVERIGGSRVNVEVLVGPGHSPATYEPTPRQMGKLEYADVFFSIGVPFERTLLSKLAGQRSQPPIVATGESPATDQLKEHDHDHAHHHHEGIDPHTWLAVNQAAAQADTICATLCRIDPAGADMYRAGLVTLQADLHRVHQQNRALLESYQGRKFFVFHPAFGHFAQEHGLVQIAVEAGGHEPGARHLAELIDQARSLDIKHIIVQPQFSRQTAQTIAQALGAAVVELDPLARGYLDNLTHIATTLAAMFAAAGKETP